MCDLGVEGIGVVTSIIENCAPIVGSTEISRIGVEMYLRGNRYDSLGKAARTGASESKNNLHREPMYMWLKVRV